MQKFYCVENPDCFHCPYSDCKATTEDLNRQKAYEKRCKDEKRNNKIIELYTKNKIKINDIAKAMAVSRSTVVRILIEGGFYDRVRHSENIQSHS